MDKFGFVVLLFVLVPGFIADQAYAACWGAEKPSDAERAIRSLIWSVFGLALYLWRYDAPPPYVPANLGQWDAASFTSASLRAIAVHTLYALYLAFVTGWFLTRSLTRVFFSAFFGRSLRDNRAWDMLWTQVANGRTVRVRVSDRPEDGFIFGHCLAASTGHADKDLLLHDPKIIDEESQIVDDLAGIRVLFIPEKQIREIRLGLSTEEQERRERRENEGNDGWKQRLKHWALDPFTAAVHPRRGLEEFAERSPTDE